MSLIKQLKCITSNKFQPSNMYEKMGIRHGAFTLHTEEQWLTLATAPAGCSEVQAELARCFLLRAQLLLKAQLAQL